MEMPKPGDAHKRLAALVGEWTGDETLHPSPWDPSGGGASAQVTNRWIADGFAVVQEYEQSRNGQVTFRGHGVFWFDPQREEYVMHWWDSMGGTAGEFRGRFDGESLTLRSSMPQGGHSRTSWVLTGPDAHDFLMEVSPDGETWQPALEGRYRKAVTKPVKKAAKKVVKKPARQAARTGTTPAGRKASAKAASSRASALKGSTGKSPARKRAKSAKSAKRSGARGRRR